MKYVIDGLLQSKIMEFKLTTREVKLLDFMKNINAYPRTFRLDIENKSYFWIKYDSFLKEYPSLNIPNAKQVGEHIKKLKQKGLIEIYIQKNPWGSLTYVCFTELYFTLLSENHSNYSNIPPKNEIDDNSNIHSDSNRSGVGAKSEWGRGKIGVGKGQNRSAYINNNPITNIHINNNPIVKEIVDYFDEINNRKTNTTTKGFAIISQKFEKILQEFTVEQIKQVIRFAHDDPYHSKIWNNLTTLSWPTKFAEKYYKVDSPSANSLKSTHEALKNLDKNGYGTGLFTSIGGEEND